MIEIGLRKGVPKAGWAAVMKDTTAFRDGLAQATVGRLPADVG